MTASRRQAQRDLEAVIDEPLERGERANHGDPDRQAVPEAFESDVTVDPRHGFSRALAGYMASCQRASVSLMYRFEGSQGTHIRCRSAFNLLTITSAGWLMTAHPSPARYPPKKLPPVCGSAL